MLLIITILCFICNVQASTQAPVSGCDVITYGGSCFSYFSSSGINWDSARTQCRVWGGDLATVVSAEQDSLLATIRNVDLTECWIGLNDLETYNVWTWADGSNSTYRNWETNEPTSNVKYVPNQNCVTKDWKSAKWDDTACTRQQRCFYCGTKVAPFQVRSTQNVSPNENTTMYHSATIRCITENKNIPLVIWSYVDDSGRRSDLSARTDVSTGVSSLSVSSPGYYSCQVTRQGVSRTYGVRIRDPSSLTDSNTVEPVYNGHFYQVPLVVVITGIYELRITDLRTQTSSPTSILVSWGLLPDQPMQPNVMFSVYYGIGDIEILAGVTSSLMYNITGLVYCVNYAIRVEMNSDFPSPNFYVKTFHSFQTDTPTGPKITSTPTRIPSDVGFVFTPQATTLTIIAIFILIILLFAIFSSANLIFCYWMTKRKHGTRQIEIPQNIRRCQEQETLIDEECRFSAQNLLLETSIDDRYVEMEPVQPPEYPTDNNVVISSL